MGGTWRHPPGWQLRWRSALALAAAGAAVRPAVAYTLEGLKKAHHSVGMKLSVEEEDEGVILQGLIEEHLRLNPVPGGAEELWRATTNIFHYADYTIVHYACLLDRDKHLRVLLDAGAPMNSETGSGVKPMHAAARAGSVRSARLLLDRGAPCCEAMDEKTVRNNDARSGGLHGMLPAHLAAQEGKVEFLRFLQALPGQARESLRSRDENGKCPLHYAVNKAKQDAVLFLTFEVGWGDVTLDELRDALRNGDDKTQALIEQLSTPGSKTFHKARMAYERKLGSEL